MKLLFLGSPGVGKGTYAQLMQNVLGIPHISSGDLLRDEVKKETELGKQINEYMQEGKLVPDEIVIKLIEERITQKDCEKGFILDGFPRTTNQAELLKELVEVSHVLHFKADDEVIIERLSGRIICKKCKAIFHKTGMKPRVENRCDKCKGELHQRPDDNPETVKKRLEVDHEKTKPLIEYYHKQGLLVEIVINKSISEVREKAIKKIKDFLEGKTKTIGEIK